MPPRTPMPSYVGEARADSPWPRLLAALVRGCLLITVVLCAFAHGPVDQTRRTPAPTPASTVLTAVEASSGHETPHGPHDHHTAEECVPAGFLRAAAQSSDQPSATGTAPLLTGAAIAARPPWQGRSRPHSRRHARSGRAALVRTSRWRI